MQETTNYKLKKPEPSDFAKIESLNENADIVDTQLKALQDTKANGTALTTLQNTVTTHINQNNYTPFVGDLKDIDYNAKVYAYGTTVNRPNNTSFWYVDIKVRNDNKNYRKLVAWNITSGDLYYLHCNNGVWGEWVEDKTATKALIDAKANTSDLTSHTSKSASAAHGKVRKEYKLYDGLLTTGSVTLPSTPYSALTSYDEIIIIGMTGRTAVGSENIKHFTEFIKPVSNIATYRISVNHTVLSAGNANETTFHFQVNLVHATRVLTINKNAYKVNNGNTVDNGTESAVAAVIGVKYE